MKKLPVLALFFAVTGTAMGQGLRIVNAASLSPVSVSPGSIITIFGSQLAAGVAAATNVQWGRKQEV
jgi:hypothetical protein